MLGSIKNMFGSKKGSTRALSYEEARQVLEEQNRSGKMELAVRRDIEPEILYYLASDDSHEVRRRVAANPATPHHADRILAGDTRDEVRGELARKIARLLPESSGSERAAVRDQAIEILETLARDQALTVRQIIAEELRSSPHAPRPLVQKLAADGDYAVCAPILEYSPLLSDDDLKEIIAFTEVKGALSAIARRARVSEEVADKIASSLDIPAVAALLANPNAQIREDTLSLIIDNAANVVDWHDPLVHRPNLSLRLMRRIASFVASALIEEMVRAHDLGAGDGEALLGRVRQRIQAEAIDAEDAAKKSQTVEELFAKGAVDEKFVIESVDQHQRETVIQALALLARLKVEDVRKIIESRNARRVTALVWKAGLSMRTACRIQAEIALVPHRQLLLARDGFDYPLTEAQMAALIEAYTD